MKYVPFITALDCDVKSYLSLDVYAYNFGDLVPDACCNVLRAPISIITSWRDIDAQILVPQTQLQSAPLIIAYNSQALRYCAMKAINWQTQQKELSPVNRGWCQYW